MARFKKASADLRSRRFEAKTQQFNTATSMGRLTLNVLLSFAQFEREVTAERIRDKIAASKKKGLWMGGPVPLGYDAKDRTLFVNEAEAETVRTIFRLYLELGSVRRVKEDADRLGLVSKRRAFANGRTTGGVALTRGRLFHLLSNPIYVGEIRHKTMTYPGQHPAIIDRPMFDAVRTKLAANTRGKGVRATMATSSPLAGKFTDETGDRLTPSHAVRRGKRHRYYVSRRLIARSGEPDIGGWRLPAVALETAVAGLITDALATQVSAQCLVRDAPPEMLQDLSSKVLDLVVLLTGADRSPLLSTLVDVGFGKPPRHTRFTKGQSGNPKGRPKGTKNLVTDLSEELREQLFVTENGKRRRVSKQRAMLKSLTAKAIKGDVQATNTILRTMERLLADDEAEGAKGLSPDDQELIDLYIKRRMSKGTDSNG